MRSPARTASNLKSHVRGETLLRFLVENALCPVTSLDLHLLRWTVALLAICSVHILHTIIVQPDTRYRQRNLRLCLTPWPPEEHTIRRDLDAINVRDVGSRYIFPSSSLQSGCSQAYLVALASSQLYCGAHIHRKPLHSQHLFGGPLSIGSQSRDT